MATFLGCHQALPAEVLCLITTAVELCILHWPHTMESKLLKNKYCTYLR